VLVVIPTYNEIDNVRGIVGRVRAAAPDADVLVVDDGSPDGTGQAADELAASDQSVQVLHRTEKLGLGAAYVAGFRWALQRDYSVIVEMDADGSHQPEELHRLLGRLSGADLVIGSRYVPHGSVVNWPRSRLLLSRGGNAYTRFCLGLPVKDATGGFRAFRRVVLETLPLDEVRSQGYCFQIDMALRTWRADFRVAEVPITFIERALGASKMSQPIVAEALWRVTWWGFLRRMPGARARARSGSSRSTRP
jgi:dolichol-phosphate mannosyltransferase